MRKFELLTYYPLTPDTLNPTTVEADYCDVRGPLIVFNDYSTTGPDRIILAVPATSVYYIKELR